MYLTLVELDKIQLEPKTNMTREMGERLFGKDK